LDFFLNKSPNYDDELNKVLALLRDNGFIWDTKSDYFRGENFTTIKVGLSGTKPVLKLDFVNDSVPLYGEIQKTSLFNRTDSIRNILSNKLSAIFRYAAKDIVDIREISINESIDWPEIINEARQKEAGLEFVYISEILTGMPQNEFETIAWVKKPDWEEFRADIGRIVYEMISGKTADK